MKKNKYYRYMNIYMRVISWELLVEYSYQKGQFWPWEFKGNKDGYFSTSITLYLAKCAYVHYFIVEDCFKTSNALVLSKEYWKPGSLTQPNLSGKRPRLRSPVVDLHAPYWLTNRENFRVALSFLLPLKEVGGKMNTMKVWWALCNIPEITNDFVQYSVIIY